MNFIMARKYITCFKSVISVIESSLSTHCLSFLFLITLSKANSSYLSLITLSVLPFTKSIAIGSNQTDSLTNGLPKEFPKTNHANKSNSSIPYF